MTRHGDDLRRVKLMREHPDFPVEYIEFLFRLDRTIDELEYTIKEVDWEKKKAREDEKKREDKAIKDLEKK